MNRPIYEIAREIRKCWESPFFGARPYIDAMRDLNTLTDNYGEDSGDSIVAYFLANAQTWRGEDARRIKRELNMMLKEYWKPEKDPLDEGDNLGESPDF